MTTLAYVFVHDAGREVDRHGYAQRLGAFHQALAASPPAGFLGSWSWQVDAGPLGGGFEDWYLVSDWTALGALNAGAVAGPRQPAHDAIATLSATGAGAVYATGSAPPPPSPPSARWRLRVSKPGTMPYPEFEAALADAAGPAATVWKRQMVLGPDREFLVDCVQRPDARIGDELGEVGPLRPLGDPERSGDDDR